MKHLLLSTILAIPLFLSADRTLCQWEFKNAKNVRSIGFPINKQARAKLSYDPMNAPGSRNGSLTVNIEYSPDILSSIPVCFQRTDLVLKKGTRYRIDFQLRSSAPFWITVQAIEGKAPWRKLGETAKDTFELPADSWQKKSLEFTASEAFSGNLRLPTFYLGKAADGTTVWIADVRLTELSKSPGTEEKEKTPAPLWTPAAKIPKLSPTPLELRKWSYADAWKQQDGERSSISLCNFWEIAPVASSEEEPPADAERWKNFIVPGHWKGGNISNFIRTDDGTALERWNGKPIASDVHHAWYRRRIDLPSSLRGKEIFLRLERIDEGGEIRVNGKRMMSGTPDPVQSVRVNITGQVKFDAENEIGNGSYSLWNQVAEQLKETLRKDSADVLFSPFSRYLDLLYCNEIPAELHRGRLAVSLVNGSVNYYSRAYFQEELIEWRSSFLDLYPAALERLLRWRGSGRRPTGTKKLKITFYREYHANHHNDGKESQ